MYYCRFWTRVICRYVSKFYRLVLIELLYFIVDLKKAAKLFATKFACGSSVTKNPAGLDEIVVQGDLQEDIFDLIRKTWKEVCKYNVLFLSYNNICWLNFVDLLISFM